MNADTTIATVLLELQGDRKPRTIAKAALGEDADPDALTKFADYYGRITRGGVPSPGLIILRSIAKGLNVSLTSIVARMEGIDLGQAIPQKNGEASENRAIGNAPTEIVGENPTEVAKIVREPRSLGATDAGSIQSAAREFADLRREIYVDFAALLITAAAGGRTGPPRAIDHGVESQGDRPAGFTRGHRRAR